MGSTFSVGDALSTLLTSEGLLFAALAFSETLSTPTPRLRRLPASPLTLAIVAVIGLWVMATGALFAWHEIFIEPSRMKPFSERVVCWAIFVGIVVLPGLATALVLGLRKPKKVTP